MEQLSIGEVKAFVNENISSFHEKKLNSLKSIKLNDILKKKNPYLFRAKNISLGGYLVENILDAFLSSSEEKMFGDFLENLAIFIAGKTVQGIKSSTTGIDLEFTDKGIRYLVSVKSGPNWGNASSKKKQTQDFQTAVRVLKQSKHTRNVQVVLGICYGKTKTNYLNGYMKVVGQNFWYLVSRNENLYTDIVEPLGYRAKQRNSKFRREHAKVVNLFTKQFLEEFCDNGLINWKKLVEFNSGNLDLNENFEKSGKKRRKK